MSGTDDLENWTLIQNPGGKNGFFKGGLLHDFRCSKFVNGFQHYLFIKNSKFIPKARFDSLKKGSLKAEDILKGEKDW